MCQHSVRSGKGAHQRVRSSRATDVDNLQKIPSDNGGYVTEAFGSRETLSMVMLTLPK